MPETPFHHFLEITYTVLLPVVLTGICVLVVKAFQATSCFVELKATVVNIRDNHLAHLDQKIDRVVEDVKEVRGQLFDHIQSCK